MKDQPAEEQCAANTDRELWREREGDYYADSIHVTAQGSIGINCRGTVYVMSGEHMTDKCDIPSNELLSRLRLHASDPERCRSDYENSVVTEAAEEIERLTEDRDFWKAEAGRWQQTAHRVEGTQDFGLMAERDRLRAALVTITHATIGAASDGARLVERIAREALL